MLAIIPSVVTSKEILQLYIKNLAGKPVISYTIEAARKSAFIERILVITNSDEISSMANSYETDVIYQELTDISFIEILERVINENGFKDFIFLNPASPFRTSNDINSAYELFLEKKTESLISCYETNDAHERIKRIINNHERISFNTSADKNGNDYDPSFVLSNAIFIFSNEYFLRSGINYTKETLPFVMPYNHSLEINTTLDLEFAEFLILKNNKEVSTIKENDLYKVFYHLTIRDSIKKLDAAGIGFISVTDESNKIVGIVTDGDFRRAVLSGVSLDDPITSIANKNFIFLKEGYPKEEMENIFLNNDIAHVPVINNDELQEIILRKNIPFIKKNVNEERTLKTPVVIMAGGIGTRLKPFTHIMPKPLIPIGNKPLIELIIERFLNSGASEFYLMLNYKANMIKAYFEERPITKNLHYLTEEFPMGTAGALKKLKEIIHSTFIVSNCDIIIKSDYRKIVEFHKRGNYDLTIVACMQHIKIPYGICSIEEGGCLKAISEKPEFDYLVNTGMYVLEPSVLDLIPDNTFFHITQLIDELKKKNRRVGVYPVYENSWIDVGQWEEYRKAIKYLE
jgi:dTDP-glucose pyrophosphorylase/CBS domain-containing protein